MRMLIPEVLTDAALVSTNLSENDHPEWDGATAYNTGDQVIIAAQHNRYEAIQANTGINPVSDAGQNWLELGATNRWKAFDQFLADPAALANQIQYELRPGSLCTAVALFGLEGSTVQLVVTDPVDGEVFNQTKALVYPGDVIDWYSYFFAGIKTDPEVLFADIPPYPDATFQIIITNTGGTAEVGQIVLGEDFEIGETRVGTGVSVEDYSRKERDTFGRPIIVERAYAQLVDFDFTIFTGNTRYVQRLIAARRAKPTVFYTAPDRQELGTLVYGLTGQLQINLSTPTLSEVTLEVEGLV